jgi:hypothetical protein
MGDLERRAQMNTALWIITGLLAAVALMGGITKTFVPKAKLAATHGGGWTEHASVRSIKALGILELTAAVGLVLPAVLDIAPFMVPVTAVCWVGLMIGAMRVHLRDRGYPFVALNVMYLACAVFIAFGRFGPASYIG